MYNIHPFLPSSILSLELTNLDHLSENFTFEYYLYYLWLYNEEMVIVEGCNPAFNNFVSSEYNNKNFMFNKKILGYLIGKNEPLDLNFDKNNIKTFIKSLRSLEESIILKNETIKTDCEKNILNFSPIHFKNTLKKSHITALSIAPSLRGTTLSKTLDNIYDFISINNKTMFTDLFVRSLNKKAIRYYQNRKFKIFRTVWKYYSDDDAYDMRKSISYLCGNKECCCVEYKKCLDIFEAKGADIYDYEL